MSIEDILRCERKFRENCAECADILRGQAEGWQRDLVRGRRNVSNSLGELSAALRDWDPPEKSREAAANYRDRLSAVRSAMAYHQASFPASTPVVDTVAFEKSLALLIQRFAELAERRKQLERSVADSER
jgi:hypothetical protein